MRMTVHVCKQILSGVSRRLNKKLDTQSTFLKYMSDLFEGLNVKITHIRLRANLQTVNKWEWFVVQLKDVSITSIIQRTYSGYECLNVLLYVDYNSIPFFYTFMFFLCVGVQICFRIVEKRLHFMHTVCFKDWGWGWNIRVTLSANKPVQTPRANCLLLTVPRRYS